MKLKEIRKEVKAIEKDLKQIEKEMDDLRDKRLEKRKAFHKLSIEEFKLKRS